MRSMVAIFLRSDLWSGDHSDTLLSPMRVKVLVPGLSIEYPALMLDYPLYGP